VIFLRIRRIPRQSVQIPDLSVDKDKHYHGDEFLKGVNIHAPESRTYTLELIDFLRRTPIEWVRIHPLPSRRLRSRGTTGTSYLEAIEKFAEAGFNLILPIDVGVRDNVGVVSTPFLRKFVDDSYGESFRAVKQIESKLSKYRGVRVIYGVENEIDTKEWILQSMPNVRWRETTLSWLELSTDKDLKFKRLGNILDGIKDAAPNSTTMVNFEADDPQDDWTTQMSFLMAAETVLSKLRILEKDVRTRMGNYRLDVIEATRRLRSIDIIGLDNYPNYLTKIPARGTDIGKKVDEVSRLASKPVINVEFGYTTLGRGTKPIKLFGSNKTEGSEHHGFVDQISLHPEEHQRLFFVNAISSIENSCSQGTFPWVLMLDPAHQYFPSEESGFTLLKIGSNGCLEPLPALDYYLSWLDGIKSVDLDRPDGMYAVESKTKKSTAYSKAINQKVGSELGAARSQPS
jgi:hypothetical protein